MTSSFQILKLINDEISSKYGNKSNEFFLIRANLLDLNRRLLLWQREENGYDEIVPLTWRLRFISLLKGISCWLRIIFLKKYDYLFFPTNETHLVQQVPVVLELIKRGKQVLLVSNKKRLFDKLPPGVPTFYLSANTNPFQFRFIALNSKAAPFSLAFISQSQARTSILAFFFQKIYRATGAKITVVGNDLSLEAQVCARAARQVGGGVHTIQHGAVSNPLHRFSLVDKFYVFGDFSKQALVRHGMDSSKVVVTGAPYLSAIGKSPKSLIGLLHLVGYPSDKTVPEICLILLSGHGHSTSWNHQQQVFKVLQTLASQLPDVLFLFKLHPKDSPNNYSKIVSSNSPILFLDNEQLIKLHLTVFDLMQHASCIVSGASASVLEAMHFGKPVFTIDLAGEYREIDFIQTGITWHMQAEQQVMDDLRLFFSKRLDVTQHLTQTRHYINHYYHQETQPAEVLIAENISIK